MADPNEIVISATFVADELKSGITEAASVWQAGFDKMGQAAKQAESISVEASTGLIRTFTQLDDSTKSLSAAQKTAIASANDLAAAILNHKNANDSLVSSTRQVKQVQDAENFSSQNLVAALKNEAIAKMQAGIATDTLRQKTIQAAEAQAILRTEIAGTQRALTWAKTNEPANIDSAALIAQAKASREGSRVPGVAAAPQTRRPDGTLITDPNIIAGEQAAQHQQAAMLLKFAGEQKATGASGQIETISADNLVIRQPFQPVRPTNLGEGELESYKEFRKANLGPAIEHFGNAKEGMAGMNQAWTQVKAGGGTPGTAGQAAQAAAAAEAQLVAAAEERLMNVIREASFAEARHKAAIAETTLAKKAYAEACENSQIAAQAELDAKGNSTLSESQLNAITELHNSTLKQRREALTEVTTAEQAEVAALRESQTATSAIASTQAELEQEARARVTASQQAAAAIKEEAAAQQQSQGAKERSTALSGLMSEAEFREAQARRQGTAAVGGQTEATMAGTAAVAENAAAATASAVASAEEAAAATSAGISAETLAAALARCTLERDAATNGMRGLNIETADGIKLDKEAAASVGILNGNHSLLKNNLGETATILANLSGQLAKHNLALVQTATGFKVVGLAAAEATAKIDAFGSTENYTAGRGLAMLTGMNNMAFSFGMLGRAAGAATGMVMTWVFVPVMIGLVIESVEKLAQSFEKVSDSMRKANSELNDLISETTKQTTALAMENLKLDDQISKLTTGFTHNAVAEALLEADIKAQQLNKTLSDTLQKETDLFEKQKIGFFSTDFLFHGQRPNTELINQFKDQSEPYREALSERDLAQHQFSLAKAKMLQYGTTDEKTGEFTGSKPGMEKDYEAASKEREAGVAALTAAQNNVVSTEDTLRKALIQYQKELQDKIAARSSELQLDKVIATDQYGHATTVEPGLNKADADKQAKADYRMNSSVINTALANLNQGDQQTIETADFAAKSKTLAQTKPPGGENIHQYTDELEKMRQAQGIHHQLSWQSEVDYWNGLFARSKAGLLQYALTDQQEREVRAQRDHAEVARDNESRTLREAQQHRAGAERGDTGVSSRISGLQQDIADLESQKAQLLAAIASHPPDNVSLTSANSGTTLESSISEKDQQEIIKNDTQTAEKRKTLNKLVAEEAIREEQEQLNDARKGSAERIEIATVELVMLEKLGLAETDAHKSVKRQIKDLEREAAREKAAIIEEEQRHTATMAELELKARKAVYDEMLPRSQKFSKDKIAHDVEYADELYTIQQTQLKNDIAAEQAKVTAGEATNAHLLKLQDQLVENEYKHSVELIKIHQQVYADRRQLEEQFSSTMERSEQEMLNSIFTGWKDFHKAVLNLEKGLLNDITGQVAKSFQSRIDSFLHPAMDKMFGVKKPATPIQGSDPKAPGFMGPLSPAQMEAKAHGGGGPLGMAAPTMLNAANIQLQAAQMIQSIFAKYGLPNPNAPAATSAPTTTEAEHLTGAQKMPFHSTGNATQDLVLANAVDQGVDPSLAWAIAKQESGFKQKNADGSTYTSKAGAKGVMQLMPDTAKQLDVNPDDLNENVSGGVRYLKQQLEANNGDVERTLRAYNAGPNAIDKSKHYPETNDYVAHVERNQDEYKAKQQLAGLSHPTDTTTTPMGNGESLGLPTDIKKPTVDTQYYQQVKQQETELTAFKQTQGALQLSGIKVNSTEQLNIDRISYATKMMLMLSNAQRETVLNRTTAAQKMAAKNAEAVQETTLGAATAANHAAQEMAKVGATVTGEGAQTAAVATGDSARQSIGLAGFLKAIIKHAAKAAAATYSWVMDRMGPPGFPIAAIAAAGAFAGTLAWGMIGGKASGGLVQGAGTGKSDSIPHMLSHGEYVIQSDAVSKLGVHTMDMLNQGQMPHYAAGGMVGAMLPKSAMSSISKNSSTFANKNNTMEPSEGKAGHTFNFAINGATDAKAVADHVMTKIQRFVRTSGVMRS